MIYKHTQRAWWCTAFVLLAIVALWSWVVWSTIADPRTAPSSLRIAGGTTVALVLIGLTFSSLTIVVRDQEVAWWFGLGLPRGHIRLVDLLDASTARTTLWQGWGVHLTMRGWLWNVSGLNAVRLRNARRRTVLLGTDRPQELLDAIARARWAGAT